MILKLTALHPAFGAEVANVSPADALDTQILEEIKQAIWQYHILLFRGRCLTAEEQIAYTKIFGEPEVYPTHETNQTGYSEIIRISNHSKEGYTNIGTYWHHDGSYRQKPTDLSFFHLLKVPDQGGDTMFADMHMAYDGLPEEVKETINNLKTVHNNGMVHSLVRHHPVTGRKALFLSVHLVSAIEGMDKEEGRSLLEYLSEHLSRPDNTYTQKWIQGDLMIVDNASVAHRATRIDTDFVRLLQRTTTKGIQAF